jgi:hypothetical protein
MGKVIGFLVVAGVVILFFIYIFPPLKEGYTTDAMISDLGPSPAISSYQQDEKGLDYRKAMLHDYTKGTLLYSDAEIKQIYNESFALAFTEKTIIGFTGNTIMIVFPEKPRLLVNDKVHIRGRYIGTKKFEATDHSEQEVPFIKADYYKLLDASSE